MRDLKSDLKKDFAELLEFLIVFGVTSTLTVMLGFGILFMYFIGGLMFINQDIILYGIVMIFGFFMISGPLTFIYYIIKGFLSFLNAPLKEI